MKNIIILKQETDTWFSVCLLEDGDKKLEVIVDASEPEYYEDIQAMKLLLRCTAPKDFLRVCNEYFLPVITY